MYCMCMYVCTVCSFVGQASDAVVQVGLQYALERGGHIRFGLCCCNVEMLRYYLRWGGGEGGVRRNGRIYAARWDMQRREETGD